MPYKIIRPNRHLGLTDPDCAELTERGLQADITPIEEYAQQIPLQPLYRVRS